MASTNIQVFYLRQQNKDTKNFSVFLPTFFVLYYGGDLISNNWNDNILTKKIMLFFFPASRFFSSTGFFSFTFFFFVTLDGWFTKKKIQ